MEEPEQDAPGNIEGFYSDGDPDDGETSKFFAAGGVHEPGNISGPGARRGRGGGWKVCISMQILFSNLLGR